MKEVIERVLEPIIRTTQIQIALTMMETLHLTQIHPEEVQRFRSQDKEATEVRMMETIERDQEMIVPTTQAQEDLLMTKTLHLAQNRPEEVQSFLSLVKKAMAALMMKTIEKDQGTRVLSKKMQKAC